MQTGGKRHRGAPTLRRMTGPTDQNQPPRITRRRALGVAAAGAGALAVSGTSLGRAAAAVPVPGLRGGLPRNPADSGIDHVVVLMMENRSFDHYLGWLPDANGDQTKLYRATDGTYHKTWHLDTFTGEGFHDPNHGYLGGRQEFHDGQCDGWLRTTNNDIYSIGYYTDDDLDFYRNAAPYWTVCDRFFASFMGPTYPNRFYMHAAQTDRISNTFDISVVPTIWDSLQAAGLNGRYYYSDLPMTFLWGSAHTNITEPYAKFLTACSTGSLPEVSFVDPRFLTTATLPQFDDHPHADIRRGQHFINEVYQAITSSPNWATTLFVITYDEWGGFFDHVAPKVVPDVDPTHGQRGFRIPTILIGPRARRNFIARRAYDHTAILKMIEWRWGLPALTPRDLAARNIAEALNFENDPDLTAPQWDVPDPDALEPTSLSSLASTTRSFREADEHVDELTRAGDLAASYGFSV
jgi:phospholipase C